MTIGTKSYAASMAMPSPNNVISNILEDAMLLPSPLENARRKREVESESDDVQDDISSYPITKVPNGCHSSESFKIKTNLRICRKRRVSAFSHFQPSGMD